MDRSVNRTMGTSAQDPRATRRYCEWRGTGAHRGDLEGGHGYRRSDASVFAEKVMPEPVVVVVSLMMLVLVVRVEALRLPMRCFCCGWSRASG